MSRKPERGSALEMLDRVTGLRRGTLVGFQRTMEPVERQIRVPGLSQFHDLRLAPAVRQVMDIARDAPRYARNAIQHANDTWLGTRRDQEQQHRLHPRVQAEGLSVNVAVAKTAASGNWHTTGNRSCCQTISSLRLSHGYRSRALSCN